MMTLRGRLEMIGRQAKAEGNNFVETAVREAVQSLATYDSRVTAAQAEKAEAVRQAASNMMLLWLIVHATDKLTIPREEIENWPGADRAELVFEKLPDGAVTIDARIRRQAKVG